jgi:CRISPR-associated protein Csm2
MNGRRGSGPRRGSGSRTNAEIDGIISEIGSLSMLKDLETKKFADEGEYADKIAKISGRDLKTNQLRKFFGAVRDIQRKESWNDMEVDFYLLKPKLAYSQGRRLIPPDFYNVMKVCMHKIDTGTDEDKVKNFNRLVEFMEAIVAYHKYYE